MSSQEDTPESTALHSPAASLKGVSACNTSVGTSPEDVAGIDNNFRDIAIIGMACRVPGGNNSPEMLWDYVLQKGDASGEIPAMRWQPYHSRHPKNAAILARTTSKGYFLDRIEDFDASFFGVSPREAEQIDPQQRIALEVAWQALEDAGIAPDSLSGSDTAVYMGVNSDDYGKLVLEDMENVGAHMGVGTAYCGIPSRISYVLNLMGPSLAVDAACASSLVAVHQARQAILAGETELALAGGVNALIGPGLTRVLDEAGALSADGKCHSFDDSASGYGRGEGAGIVVLKRLDKAIEDGDRIHGVLKGSAVCADGKTVGIMAPNAAAQQLVAQKALSEAKTPADTISYVEAHATSTALGDPTEMGALANVYGGSERRRGHPPCYVGSVKSNIGHLEAAAGVLGLIKATLVVKHGLLPGQANLNQHSTKIDWQKNGLQVTKDSVKLYRHNLSPLRAAIASYGYSGTVSHAIIEAKASSALSLLQHGGEEELRETPVILFLSGPQQNRLSRTAESLAEWLQSSSSGKKASLKEVSNTLSSRRAHHRFRTSVVVATRAEAILTLENLSKGRDAPYVIHGRISPELAARGPVWLFSGHGAQWSLMGRELLETQPGFAHVVQQLEPIVQEELGFSITEAFASGKFNGSDEIQILTFAMHLGLASLLLEKAGPPAAIVGHSLGEAAAAVVAGAITLEEGAVIVCSRARLYRRHMGRGAMALISLSADEIRARLSKDRDAIQVEVAIDASSSSCVVAGPRDAIQRLSQVLKDEQVEVRAVRSDIAFHNSGMLSELANPLRQHLDSRIHPMTPRICLYSTSSPNPRSTDLRDVEYWINNMVEPVRLKDTITAVGEDGYRVIVEVSSHPIVSHSVHQTLEEMGLSDAIVIPTMLRDKPAMKQVLNCVGKLHCTGIQVAYTRPNRNAWDSDVPRTLWSPEPFWRTVAKVPFGQIPAHVPASNNLLGACIAVWGTDQVLFQTHVDETSRPYPGKHPLHGAEIVPAAVLINTFLHATDKAANCLERVSLKVPVVVNPGRQLQILVRDQGITITSRSADSSENSAWLVNTTTRIAPKPEVVNSTPLRLTDIRSRLRDVLPKTFTVDYLANVGVPEMGFPWTVEEHLGNDKEMLARVQTNPENVGGLNDLGASILDAATSIASTIFYKEPLLRMPTAIDRIIAHGNAATMAAGYVYCKRAKTADWAVDMLVCAEDGQIIFEFQSMAFAGLENDRNSPKSSTSGLVHSLCWPPASFAETPLNFSHVVFISDSSGKEESGRYATQLTRQGYSTSWTSEPDSLLDLCATAIVVHVPTRTNAELDVADAASISCQVLVSAAKAITLGSTSSKPKLISLCCQNDTESDLASSPLYGLARIMKSEIPDVWSGLFEAAGDGSFPLTAIKYIQGEDVVRYEDGVHRTARLRPFSSSKMSGNAGQKPIAFSPGGTYLITGGLGALGLEVAKWMVGRGARRILLVSRRKLPHRHDWKNCHEQRMVLDQISALEHLGATVHILAMDISVPGAHVTLGSAIESLSLPPVTGVVHAAGVLDNQRVEDITTEAFNRVLAPKVNGALCLDKLFPSGTLEFFLLFSSCGQLVGFPGQASYASANAWLDALADHRRKQGDNATSILWTSWRGLGMAASTEYINAELEARGISDITTDEAFLAWDFIASLNTSQAVVLRALPIDVSEDPAHPILKDITPRRPTGSNGLVSSGLTSNPQAKESERPRSGKELESYLSEVLCSAVAATLCIPEPDVDPSVALSEMGMDSVMTLSFRTRVQKLLKVKMAPTLVWKCPTVQHLVKFFANELQG